MVHALAGSLACAQSDVFWISPVSGLWSDAANWSDGSVPGASGMMDRRVNIDLAGSYTVDLDFDASVSGLVLANSSATLRLTGATGLTTFGDNQFSGANIMGSGATTLTTGGLTVFSGGATIAGMSSANFGGRTEFNNTDDIDLCDTCVFLTGEGVWTGGGSFNLENDSVGSEIVIAAGGSLALLGSGTRTIQGIGSGNQFVNRGELLLDLDGGADALEVAGSRFLNARGAEIRLESGTLRSDLSGTLSGTSLRGGDWVVGENGAVDTMGAAIQAIDVSVTLDGAGSSFVAVDALRRVTNRGALRVMGGKSFATAVGVSLEVEGEVEVGAGSVVTVTDDLMNLDGGTLTDGSFVVGGRLELMEAGAIQSLEAGLTLEGAGMIDDGSGADLLAGLGMIGADGAFALRDGASFTTVSDLGLQGSLDIGRGSMADVRGDLGAFAGGVLGDAALRVAGDLIASNTRVEAVKGDLVVGLDGRILLREGGGGTVDGLSFLREIRLGGSVELEGGRDLDIRAGGNTVALEGGLILGSTASGDSDAVLGSVLTVDGVGIADSGVLTSSIAGLDNFGRVDALAASFGAGAPGETAGELVLIVEAGYAAAFGDRFLILKADLVEGEGFSLLTVLDSTGTDLTGDLGGGLFFEQFIDGTGVGVVVLPSPSGLAAVGIGLLGASRRRRGA